MASFKTLGGMPKLKLITPLKEPQAGLASSMAKPGASSLSDQSGKLLSSNYPKLRLPNASNSSIVATTPPPSNVNMTTSLSNAAQGMSSGIHSIQGPVGKVAYSELLLDFIKLASEVSKEELEAMCKDVLNL